MAKAILPYSPMRTRLALALLVPSFVLGVTTSASAQDSVDHETLATLLGERGFVAPEGFKALVVRIDQSADGTLTQRYFDWQGTSRDRDDWWPASSVKIFAAVAALERLHALGFPIHTWLTYHYDEGEVTRRMDHIIRHALELSSNSAFDQLVELVGFDEINTEFFVPDNGFVDTVFLRAYGGRNRDPATSNGLNRNSPRITLRRGSREREVPPRNGRGNYACPDQGNCTTMIELAEVMRRIMLHEMLPENERYALRSTDLEVIRDSLARARNHDIADIFQQAFGEIPVRVFHKPGYAVHWVSDVLFLHRTDTNERYIVVIAAQPDRRALDDAARLIGTLLASGALSGR
jgi:hypothetical protein